MPVEPPPLAQIATFFTLTDARMAGGQYFVAGTGYVEIDGGGTYFSGPNRKQDPYLEVTVIAVVGQAFEQCRNLLVQPSFEENAVRITGTGKFMSMPGIGEKRLGIVRMDSLSDCKLVPRR